MPWTPLVIWLLVAAAEPRVPGFAVNTTALRAHHKKARDKDIEVRYSPLSASYLSRQRSKTDESRGETAMHEVLHTSMSDGCMRERSVDDQKESGMKNSLVKVAIHFKAQFLLCYLSARLAQLTSPSHLKNVLSSLFAQSFSRCPPLAIL